MPLLAPLTTKTASGSAFRFTAFVFSDPTAIDISSKMLKPLDCGGSGAWNVENSLGEEVLPLCKADRPSKEDEEQALPMPKEDEHRMPAMWLCRGNPTVRAVMVRLRTW
mmetsp:Transcript_9662/g.15494  ORF Transcript_9662/g.15494 Transcript_9662/m.15494 type:complete len:109 (-) Transcript_9662:11-337(-)